MILIHLTIREVEELKKGEEVTVDSITLKIDPLEMSISKDTSRKYSLEEHQAFMKKYKDGDK